ncbi:unnamed protein product [Bursaphelenchus okinawaensis]|uniref:Uncharacterized protein n=1 Tax=Bursaphelenchus okinawaensis TaxID=465554 RepID=A0A811L969_9BILA|nr:unnamed protein product [Bursaphelenchus okinawaensis]CAG9119572.1 unnamed protein product [Bursaphelenchus okinawaensis]
MSQKEQPNNDEEERLKRMNDVFDKCDNEQFEDLANSKRDYLVLILHLRRLYYSRIGVTIMIIVCMLIVLTMFVLYRIARQKLKEELGSCGYFKCPNPPRVCPQEYYEELDRCELASHIQKGKVNGWIVCPNEDHLVSINPDVDLLE